MVRKYSVMEDWKHSVEIPNYIKLPAKCIYSKHAWQDSDCLSSLALCIELEFDNILSNVLYCYSLWLEFWLFDWHTPLDNITDLD